MHVRRILTGFLIVAMLAGNIRLSVPAEEIDMTSAPLAATSETASETAEMLPENDITDSVTIVTETESETETETEAEAATVTETIPETGYDDQTEPVTETMSDPVEETAPAAQETELSETEALETETETQSFPETESPELLSSEIEEEAVLLDASTPRAATAFKAEAADTYVKLSWQPGTDAKGNRIEMYDVSADTYSWIAATQKNYYSITGLKPEHTYKFRLLAWRGTNPDYIFGEYTSWITVKTVLFTPSTPTELKATAADSSVTLSWKASSYAQKYRVQMYDAAAKKYSWCAYTSSPYTTINGLTRNQSYKFRVQAYRNAAGIYTYSGYTSWVSPQIPDETVTIASSASLIKPGTPTGLSAKAGDKSVTLTWKAGSKAHKYRIRVYDSVSHTSYWGASTVATSATITGLQNNHSYKFRVQAYRNNSGTYTYSSYTPWLTVAVTPLAGTKAIGWNNSVILEWPKVSGATQYKIYSVNISTGKRTWVRSLGSNYQEFRLNGLKNGTTYAYRIYAYKNGSIYAYSSTVRATATEPRAKYVSTALKYLGAAEGSALHKEIIDLYNTQNPVPAGYKMTYTAPWCAAFTTAMAIKANVIRMIPGECSCTRQIALWKQLGYYVAGRSYTPSVGDLVYYSWTKNSNSPDHVGIVSKVSGSTLYVVEGNKSNAVSERVINDYKHYGYIIGYGKPNGN